MMAALALIDRIFFTSDALSSSDLRRSILLSRILSANAICSTDSFSTPSGLTSSRWADRCAASTTVRMASRYRSSLRSSSTKKVCATGAGSARPVVSMMMWSNASFRRMSLLRIRMRSWRTVQQMHPLFISKISSLVSTTRPSSTPTSPNSFSMMAMRLPCLAVRMWLTSVVFPAPRKPVMIVTGVLSLSVILLDGVGRRVGR
mmetsp:Transcript_1792/g.7464  ORF Transcript_1792/g.7464 Transcript_1792/m.7464 type:complete len:203 (+) Transcript_1792:528-1136(+)